jgi:hypothetical protein
MAQRAAIVVKSHKVQHASLVINWDQSGIHLMAPAQYSYSSKQSKQVPILGFDDKRCVTAVVACSLAGDLLPLQLVFTGQDTNTKQQKSIPTLDPPIQAAVRSEGWHLTQTRNHWSSMQSMKDYMTKIIVPYIEQQRLQHNCPESHALLLFDCWSVHRSAEWLSYISNTHPHCHVVFIPAGCTGKAQPADLMLQRPLKHEFGNRYTDWVTEQLQDIISAGVEPTQVKLDTGMGVMKPKLVEWMMSSWKLLRSKRVLIQKGWEKAGLDKVMQPATQDKALEALGAGVISIDQKDVGLEEADTESAADAAELQAETAMDENDEPPDDEEEIDADVCLAALIEDRLVVGTRRSMRVREQFSVRRDHDIARYTQEQILDDAVYDS